MYNEGQGLLEVNSFTILDMCMRSHFSCVWFFVTPWTIDLQGLLSMGFSRQEYWSGLPCPPIGDLHNPGIEPTSGTSPTLAGKFFIINATWETHLRPTVLFLFFSYFCLLFCVLMRDMLKQPAKRGFVWFSFHFC